MKSTNTPLLLLAALASLASTAPSTEAALIVTYAEDANAVQSTLANTSVFSFNNLPTNVRSTGVEWTGVGTFDALYIQNADSYGGAVDPGFVNGSPYSVQSNSIGGGNAVAATTLSLNSDHAYFGLWWSAGDPNNVLGFYDGGSLVAEFTTATLLNVIASQPEYKGNPRNRSLNAGESYAFINFFGTEGVTWDRIVLTNNAGSGFESDNYTDRAAPWTPAEGPMPGRPLAQITGTNVVALPEPSSAAFALLASALGWRRRRPAAKA